jgi:methylated-DNA-[protein]-cysteine S-methyltransferase
LFLKCSNKYFDADAAPDKRYQVFPMAMNEGSCRFGWWHVHVLWTGDTIQNIRFSKSPLGGDVPVAVKNSLREQSAISHRSGASQRKAKRSRQKSTVPCRRSRTGSATYGEIAAIVGTWPRVVGNAMARNPTPLIVPCHRVVGVKGLGGFSPSIEIKKDLLEMERRRARTIRRSDKQ